MSNNRDGLSMFAGLVVSLGNAILFAHLGAFAWGAFLPDLPAIGALQAFGLQLAFYPVAVMDFRKDDERSSLALALAKLLLIGFLWLAVVFVSWIGGVL